MTEAEVEPSSEWAGACDRECGEHRTTGGRAWCFADSEWCSPKDLCRGCELPEVRAEVRRLTEMVERAYGSLGNAEKMLADLGEGK